MPTVYIETSVVSYLTARPSRDVITLARQQITREWWKYRRSQFELCTGDIVLGEAAEGDDRASSRRSQVLANVTVLQSIPKAEELASELLRFGPLPRKAAVDSLHIAIAAVHGVDYLLTWNCAHIANAEMREPIESICRSKGYDPPIMCTPAELLEV